MKRSLKGYKKGSPDKNEPSLLIPSNNITMEDVEFPILGIDDLGNQKIMLPGKNYLFPGKQVTEIPMKQDGGYVEPKGYKPSNVQQRNNWNNFLDYLDKNKIGGSEDLDKRDKTLGLDYLKKYNKENPNTAVDEGFIPTAQYESYLIRKKQTFPGLSEEQSKYAFSSLAPQFLNRPISPVDNWLGSYTSKQYYPNFERATKDGTIKYNADFEGFTSIVGKKQDGGAISNVEAAIRGTKYMTKDGKIDPIKQNNFNPTPFLGIVNAGLTKMSEYLRNKEIEDYNRQMVFLQNQPQIRIPTTQEQYGNPSVYQIGGLVGPEDLSYLPSDEGSMVYSPGNQNAVSDVPRERFSFPTNNVSEAAGASDNSTLKKIISDKESGGNYHALPKKKDGTLASSAAGKYQFLWKAHSPWIKKLTGVSTKEEFLNNPEAQEKAFDYWDATTLTPWAEKIQAQSNTKDPLAIIKTKVHFAGPGGAIKYYLKGEETKDAFGTSTSSYQEGGEYTVSHKEALRILQEGGEIEFIK